MRAHLGFSQPSGHVSSCMLSATTLSRSTPPRAPSVCGRIPYRKRVVYLGEVRVRVAAPYLRVERERRPWNFSALHPYS
eukprot:6245300-Prymnesium_polylepis.1